MYTKPRTQRYVRCSSQLIQQNYLTRQVNTAKKTKQHEQRLVRDTLTTLCSNVEAASCSAKVDKERFYVPSGDDVKPGMTAVDASGEVITHVHPPASASNSITFMR
jgi:hypothetical protein